MTVADNTSRNQYTATSGQTVFAYTFEIVDKDDIVVLKNGTTLSEGTDYTVSNVGNDNGGNVTLTVGATTGDILTLYRDMPYSRTQNYTNSGDFLASEVNSDFDNLWLAGEQTNRSFSQSIRKPITDSDSISMELPEAADRANKFVLFDSTGAVGVESLSTGTGPTVIGRQQFTGDGTTTVFTLAADSSSAAAVIYIDGVYQEQETYTVVGTTLTFTEAPPTNASIEVLAYKITDVGTTDANAVTYTPAGTGAVQTTVQTKLRESVSVKDFGAVGDGVTDDTAALQNAFTAADGKTLIFPEAETYLISSMITANNVTIVWNGCKITGNFSGPMIEAAGAVGTYQNLSENAYKHSEFIKCSNTSFLDSLEPGDLLKIISDEVGNSDPSEQDRKIGEMHLVKSVDSGNGIIYLNNNLFDTYFTSDTARVAKVSYVTFECVDRMYLKNNSSATNGRGINLEYAYGAIVKGSFIDCMYDAVTLDSCYAPRADVDISNSSNTGGGVAMHPINATIFADLTGNWFGSRHAFTSGGSSDGGMVWQCHVHDAKGESAQGQGVFDTHAHSGSVYFENVTAIGGINSTYTSTEDWDASTAYSSGDYVFSPDGYLFEAVQANTGNDPDDDTSITNWEHIPGNGEVGFAFEGRNQYIKDCTVIGCEAGVSASNTSDAVETFIDGLTLKNVWNGLSFSATESGSIIARNVSKFNHMPVTNYCFSFGGGKIDRIDISGVSLYNCPLADIGTIVSSDRLSIDIANVTSQTDALINVPFIDSRTRDATEVINLTNVYADKFIYYFEQESSSTEVLDVLNINGGGMNEASNRFINIEDQINNINITNFVGKGTTNSGGEFIRLNAVVNYLGISSSIIFGSNMTEVVNNNGANKLTHFYHSGNDFEGADLWNNEPDIEILSGSLDKYGTIRVSGTPEGAITADKGTLCLRRDGGAGTSLYIKESGTGNTGWAAK